MNRTLTALCVGLLILGGPTDAVEDPASKSEHLRTELSGSQGPIQWESLLGKQGLQGWKVDDHPWTPTA